MESEKIKEIKKALEQNDDNGIMYEVNDQKRTCKFIHHKDILTLINELESENERLKEENGVLSCDLDLLNEKLTNAEIEVSDYQDKMIELNSEIAELEKEKKEYGKKKFLRGWKLGTEELAERLKEKLEEYRLENEYFIKDEPNGNLWQMNSSVFCIEVTQDGGLIDETLKEFIK